MKKRLGIDSILNKEKGQWWRTLDVYKIVRAVIEPASAVKSLTSFSTSFLRYCKIYPCNLDMPIQTHKK